MMGKKLYWFLLTVCRS